MTHTKRRGGLMKSATGIPGFDEITGGGLPQGRTTLITGGPGSGKTVFALQSLVTGALQGEPGILITFQENPRQVVENAATFGWNLTELEKDKLVILDGRIRPNTFNSIELYLSGMLAGIRVVANELGARRIVFDSFDAFLSLLGDRTTERQEIARLRDWLLESGLTAVITAQTECEEHFVSSRHGSMQFMADCVVRLDYDTASQTASRSLRVLKYRGSGFVENIFALAIGNEGVEITSAGLLGSGKCTLKNALDTGIDKEITTARSKFETRIRSLSRKLEIKQAELDFLRTASAANKLSELRPNSQNTAQLGGRGRNHKTVRKSSQSTSPASSAKKV